MRAARGQHESITTFANGLFHLTRLSVAVGERGEQVSPWEPAAAVPCVSVLLIRRGPFFFFFSLSFSRAPRPKTGELQWSSSAAVTSRGVGRFACQFATRSRRQHVKTVIRKVNGGSLWLFSYPSTQVPSLPLCVPVCALVYIYIYIYVYDVSVCLFLSSRRCSVSVLRSVLFLDGVPYASSMLVQLRGPPVYEAVPSLWHHFGRECLPLLLPSLGKWLTRQGT